MCLTPLVSGLIRDRFANNRRRTKGKANLTLLLSALECILADAGVRVPAGAASAAAAHHFELQRK